MFQPGMVSGKANCSQVFSTPMPGPGGNCTLPGRVCLRGGGEHEGNVFIGLGRGISKPVCDDNWDMKDGIVVCRELGYHDIVEVCLSITVLTQLSS